MLKCKLIDLTNVEISCSLEECILSTQQEDNSEIDQRVFCHCCYKLILGQNFIQKIVEYQTKLDRYKIEINDEFHTNEKIYKIQRNKYNELYRLATSLILKKSFFIGMTTSCAARNHRYLKDIGVKIILVEEAAHVFESHIIAALSPSVQHLILIGDHRQMRAFTSEYILAQKNFIDISMFRTYRCIQCFNN